MKFLTILLISSALIGIFAIPAGLNGLAHAECLGPDCIEATGDPIVADSDTTIINNTTITTDSPATNTTYAASSVENGTGIQANHNNTVINNGTITSGSTGIAVGDNNTVTNTGTVDAGFTGVQAGGNDNTVENSGSITSDGFGVQVGDRGVVNNSAEGSIEGEYVAVYGTDGITLTNEGFITANGDGVSTYMGSNTIVNNGMITANYGQAINGGPGTDTIVNNGTMNGGISTGGGDDNVIIGGAVDGRIDGGTGSDSLTFTFTVTAAEYADLAAQLSRALPAGGQITFQENVYTWRNFEELHHLLDVLVTNAGQPIQITISDGRLNGSDLAATAMPFCAGDGMSLYGVDAAGGVKAFDASAAQIMAALSTATSSGQNVLINEVNGVSLWALYSNELQVMGPGGYLYILPPDVCAIGG